MTPTVAICMIVKNEEQMLPCALNSVKDWADEIIIVDTGSTDRTVAIAKQYGAKVHTHLWQNDFSLHRNQSIGYAESDWICILDADEEITSDMTRFKENLARVSDDVSGLVVRVHEKGEDRTSTSWLGVRFFRRSSGIHYKGIVHNKAVYDGDCAATDIEMNHYGYSLSLEKMAAKRERTKNLLLARLDADPKDHAALYYMCQLNIGEKDYDSAKDYGLRFFECVPVGPNDFQFYSVMYFYMAWICLHLEDGEWASAWALKGLEFYPDDLDLNHIMTRIGYQAKRDDWLDLHGNKYLELLKAIRSAKENQPDTFESPVDASFWSNRTIYTNDDAAEGNVRKMMEVLGG